MTYLLVFARYTLLAIFSCAVQSAGVVVLPGSLSKTEDSSFLMSKRLARPTYPTAQVAETKQRDMIQNATLRSIGSAVEKHAGSVQSKLAETEKLVEKASQQPYHRREVPPPPPGPPPSSEPKEYFGVSKLWWAVVANVLALMAFVACIPCVLTIAKRRRAVSSS
mmetsp:Transcript_55347/g.86107  ORF Transcript_55347/g.86107 Transcript_55347/m.86107 type:complete len:165 (-) Transcript_55347:35-529(-)